MTSETIKSAWKITGNWPISRQKALIYLEIQANKEKCCAERELDSDDEVPKSGWDIINLAGPQAMVSDWLKFRKIGIAFNAKQAKLALVNKRIWELKAQVKRIKAKKQKAIPNLNRKFMELYDILGSKKKAGNALNQKVKIQKEEPDEIIKVVEDSEDDGEDVNDALPLEIRT